MDDKTLFKQESFFDSDKIERHLNAILPPGEIDLIKPIIGTSQAVDKLSANQLFMQLQTQKTDAPIFKPLRDFLADVEGVYSTTYPDSISKMTLGIGLNIKDNNAFPLLYELDPERDWDYSNMQTTKGLPNPELSDAEINQLLCLTLIGVDNAQGKFVGLTTQLIHKLGALADTEYELNQLIALQSLVFNLPTLLAGGMLKALTNMEEKGTDLEPLQELIEKSNQKKDIGLQNRRLKEGALFHGSLEDPYLDIHLTKRQYESIIAVNKDKFNVKLYGGPVIWPLPSSNAQQDFSGYDNATHFPSGDLLPDTTYCGTKENDNMQLLPFGIIGSPIGLGGDGNDTMSLCPTKYNFTYTYDLEETGYPYLAGGEGYDTYNINTFFNLDISIFDTDRKGVISTPYHCLFFPNLFANISGVAINGKLFTCDKQYNITLTEELDHTNSLSIESTAISGREANITISDFKSGQFGIFPDGVSYPFALDPSQIWFSSRAISTDGIIAIQKDGQTDEFLLYNIQGMMVSSITIENYTLYPSRKLIVAPKGLLYASAFENASFGGDNTTLYGVFIDGKSTNFKFNPLMSLEYNSGCDVNNFYFYDVQPFSLTSGNIVSLLMIDQQKINSFCLTEYTCFLNAYLKNTTLPIDTYAGPCSMAPFRGKGWSLANGNFLINYISGLSQQNKIMLYRENGVVYRELTWDEELLNVCGFDDGFIALIRDRASRNIYSRTYQENQTYPSEMLVKGSSVMGSTIMQAISDDKVFLFLNTLDAGFIINADNTRLSGPFSLLSPEFSSISAVGSIQENGDIVLFASYVARNGTKLLSSYFLPTSVLKPSSPLITNTTIENDSLSFYNFRDKSLAEKTPQKAVDFALSQFVKNTVYDNPANSFENDIIFDEGAWDSIISKHPETREDIFTYRIYQEGNEIGSISFYKHPLLCRSEDGNSHNIIATTGVLTRLEIDCQSLENICAALPPTLFDRVIKSAEHGTIAGLSNLVGYTLQAKNVPVKVAKAIQKSTYYAGYFLMRFYNHLQQEKSIEWENTLNATIKAAYETGSIFLVNKVINKFCSLTQQLGNHADSSGWTKTGSALKFFSRVGRYGVFACHAKEQGLIEAASCIAAGTLTQTVVEHTGKQAIDRLFKIR